MNPYTYTVQTYRSIHPHRDGPWTHLCWVQKVWAGIKEFGERKRRFLGLGGVKRKQKQGLASVNASVALLLEASSSSGLNKGETFQSSVRTFVCLSASAIFLSYTLQASLPHIFQRQLLFCGNSTHSTSPVLKPFVGWGKNHSLFVCFFENLIKVMDTLYKICPLLNFGKIISSSAWICRF